MRDLPDNSKTLLLEEAVLDDLAKDFSALEMPLEKSAFNLVGIFALFVGGVVLAQIFFVGVLRHEWYAKKALANARFLVLSEAERGVIFDRFGTPLTENVPSYTIAVRIADFMKNRDTERARIAELEQILNLKNGNIEALIDKVNLETQDSLTVVELAAQDASTLGRIMNLRSKSIYVKNAFTTAYPYGPAFAHVLGYVGKATKEDLARDPSLFLNSDIGKDGLELQYDRALRGEDGERAIYKDARGYAQDTQLLTAPVQGDSLYTTVDAGLQKYFYERLVRALSETGSKAAVGIALNPQNGEVLSLVSVPSFDGSRILPGDLSSPLHPLFNRVVSGTYSPGSTIKPLHGVAALKERVIAPLDQIFSRGYITVDNPYDPQNPYRFVDWKPHGWVNLYSAIARSSDVYFYAIVGGLPRAESKNIVEGGKNMEGLGIGTLKQYWQLFGLGKKTGIDLPGEKNGFLPDPQYKMAEERQSWKLGDTYNVSIGQGDLLVTPIQLVNYVSAIGNGGKVYRPFVVKKVTNESGAVVREAKPEMIRDESSLGPEISEVQKGMEDTVRKPYGNAYALSSLPVSVAGKTGTAQTNWNKKVNALFAGYAPAAHPTIAFLVLMEDAREGSLNAIPVAKDVLRWYYENRITKTSP